MAQAVGGLMHITGAPDGPPQKVGVAITDVMTGVLSAGAVCVALQATAAVSRSLNPKQVCSAAAQEQLRC